ncbi:hypothetical protein L208DRAFT_1518948 [Tricholoma matsutake]|nr:hypothetical protein L208DRAFT_1518948 [Tricholoma matsutake 945]
MFVTQSLRFMNAHQMGLNGTQAAWAAMKFRGHRTIPSACTYKAEPRDVVTGWSQPCDQATLCADKY